MARSLGPQWLEGYRPWADYGLLQCIGGHGPGRFLPDLPAHYEALASRPSPGDPPDHIAVKPGLLGYLGFKEVYAVDAGNEEAARTVRDAAAAFRRLDAAPHALSCEETQPGKRSEPSACRRTGRPRQIKSCHGPGRPG